MRKTPTKKDSQERRGAVLLLFLVLFPLLVLFVGFSIDFAQMQQSRTELRRSADLAARAAALSLSLGSDESIAWEVAADIASENHVAGEPLRLGPEDVTFGTTRQDPDGSFQFVRDGNPTNAVQVIGNRTEGSASGPIDTYFGALYNSPTFKPQISATAAFVNTDICLVLDRSTSMKWKVIGGQRSDTRGKRCFPPTPDSRWVALEAAVNKFIEIMGTSPAVQKVAMVSFASNVQDCEGDHQAAEIDVPLSEDLSLISTAMAERTASVWVGRTDIASGIKEAQTVLSGPGARSTAHKFMVVMTDGGFTEDNPVPYAEIAAANGIQVYTVTFSDGAKQGNMVDVAEAGNGFHYHAEGTDGLITVFESLAGTISKVIQ